MWVLNTKVYRICSPVEIISRVKYKKSLFFPQHCKYVSPTWLELLWDLILFLYFSPSSPSQQQVWRHVGSVFNDFANLVFIVETNEEPAFLQFLSQLCKKMLALDKELDLIGLKHTYKNIVLYRKTSQR